MSENILDNVGVVILAAGRGTRLNCTSEPKVMLEIGHKPIVSYIVETLESAKFFKKQIVLVVGFQEKKVKEYFGDKVMYASQEKQMGTAHAAYVGSKVFPENIKTILIMGGDDSAFYTKETLADFIQRHIASGATLSLLTTQPDNFEMMGRVIRDENGRFVGVLEKEQLNEEQKRIRETSTGTYCLDRVWFENIFLKMERIDGLGELGLPKAAEMAVERGKKVLAVKLKNNDEWFGINTVEELSKADELKSI